MKHPPTAPLGTANHEASANTPYHHHPRRRIRSDDPLAGSREVLIEHCGELYSLRQTSKGKLILTK